MWSRALPDRLSFLVRFLCAIWLFAPLPARATNRDAATRVLAATDSEAMRAAPRSIHVRSVLASTGMGRRQFSPIVRQATALENVSCSECWLEELTYDLAFADWLIADFYLSDAYDAFYTCEWLAQQAQQPVEEYCAQEIEDLQYWQALWVATSYFMSWAWDEWQLCKWLYCEPAVAENPVTERPRGIPSVVFGACSG